MSLAELFIIAVGLSMDAFAVSVCKGLAMPRMNWKGAFIVGLYFGLSRQPCHCWDTSLAPGSAWPSRRMTTGLRLSFWPS